MKKRLLSVVLSLCLILSLLPTTVFAIDSAAISSTKSTVKAGETFDVSLVIPSNSAKKAYSASFRFYFDNTVFEVVNFTPPTIGGNLQMDSTQLQTSSHAHMREIWAKIHWTLVVGYL